MAFTKRQKIVTVITESLEQILTANDFETDLGSLVADWRTDWQEDDLTDSPGTSVCDLTAERIDELSNEAIDYFVLPVQIRTSFSATTRPTEARKFLGDILAALAPLKDGFRNEEMILAENIDLKREGFVLAEDGFNVAAVAVEIEILFFTSRFNAYE